MKSESSNDRLKGPAGIRVLTPLAAGAIAVVQIVGPGALAIAEQIFRARRGVRLGDVPAGRAVYGDFIDAAGEIFDDGLAIHGHITNDTWVEFNLHSGLRIVQKLILAAQGLGAAIGQLPIMEQASKRPEHGKFNPEECGGTAARRNDAAISPSDCGAQAASDTRSDPTFHWLSPVERWMQTCLSEASTQQVVRWLAEQPALWHEQVSVWLKHIEQDATVGVLREAQVLLEQATVLGQAWRGKTIAIIGPPNVGKSTLCNRLAGRNISLIADLPGTTRDWVGEPIAVQGWPVTIIDTAGLRTSEDAVEAEGVERAKQRAAEADVRLLVLDAQAAETQDRDKILDQYSLKTYDVVTYNKCDLPHRRSGNGRETGPAENLGVFVSALTGQGWSLLEQKILAACGFAALHEQKPLVFCAELQDRLDDLVSSLRSQRISEARAVLESLREDY